MTKKKKIDAIYKILYNKKQQLFILYQKNRVLDSQTLSPNLIRVELHLYQNVVNSMRAAVYDDLKKYSFIHGISLIIFITHLELNLYYLMEVQLNYSVENYQE